MSTSNQELSIKRHKTLYPIHNHFEDAGCQVLTAEKDSKFILFIWKGKRQEPFIRTYYKTEVDRQVAIIAYIQQQKAIIESVKAEREARKKLIPEIKVGDIYVSSWGYEQTNVNSYQVTEIASKHFAILQAISNQTVPESEGRDSDFVQPLKDSFLIDSEPLRRKVTLYQEGGKQYVKIDDVRSASKWDGKSNYYRSWYY